MSRHIHKSTIAFVIFLHSCISLLAQAPNTDGLQQAFQQYQLHNLQEKIFVHTDKSVYLAGEIVWFKIYCVDESFNKPLDISSVTYIEIINESGKPVLQAKI